MGDIEVLYLLFIVKELMTVSLLKYHSDIDSRDIHSVPVFMKIFCCCSHKREEFPCHSNITLEKRSAHTVVALTVMYLLCFLVMHFVLGFSIGKNRRLKQAKEEAQAEIEQYRLQREKEFKTKEAAVRFIHLF